MEEASRARVSSLKFRWSHTVWIKMKRFVLSLGCLLFLAGCAGGPNVTLLGVVGIGEELPLVANDTAVADATTQPDANPLAMAAETAPTSETVLPIDTTTTGSTISDPYVSAGGAANVQPPMAGGGAYPRLKTQQEVKADEDELRRLAQNAPKARSRSLWSASVDVLKQLRLTHGDKAIEKIEADPTR